MVHRNCCRPPASKYRINAIQEVTLEQNVIDDAMLPLWLVRGVKTTDVPVVALIQVFCITFPVTTTRRALLNSKLFLLNPLIISPTGQVLHSPVAPGWHGSASAAGFPG